ncbi:hypothetical protein ACFY04_28770 [Streptomyces sp. NPDC001549]|uniref:hypothetical protein n=1 Tax=Streptomyces sp. NPDC001549 TaxID=3364586 RepID=UPI0036B3BDD3
MRIASLVRDAGALPDLEAARALRAEIRDTSITAAEAVLELAFHHAIQGEEDKLRAVISRLRELARTGDCAYYTEIAHFMAGLPLPAPSSTIWCDDPDSVRSRWHQVVQDRRTRLGTAQ